jgi:hypothetical protein
MNLKVTLLLISIAVVSSLSFAYCMMYLFCEER